MMNAPLRVPTNSRTLLIKWFWVAPVPQTKRSRLAVFFYVFGCSVVPAGHALQGRSIIAGTRQTLVDRSNSRKSFRAKKIIFQPPYQLECQFSLEKRGALSAQGPTGLFISFSFWNSGLAV